MPRLTAEQREECVKRYVSGESTRSISAEYGVSDVAIRGLVRRRGFPTRGRSEARRTKSLNHSFFRDVDSEEKAYWLGFLLADGCVSGNQVAVRLAICDLDHVMKFRAAIGSNHKVTIVSGDNGEPRAAQLAIKSPEMVADLSRLGVKPNKSLTAVPPSVPDSLARHFWRGVFDGDGNLYLPNPTVAQNYTVRLYGSKATCDHFSKWVESTCGIRPAVTEHKSIYMARTSGLRQSSAVASALYGNSAVVLDRKRCAFQRIIKIASRPRTVRLCQKPECGLKHHQKGFCRNHFYCEHLRKKRRQRYLEHGK